MNKELNEEFFKDKNEKEARKAILDIVGAYCDKYHNIDKDKPYIEGERIPYARRVYDKAEMTNLVDSALEFWLTMGHYTAEFEEKFAGYLGVKHVNAVNSGSGANLLSFMALTDKSLGDRAIKRGDEVITVAAGFPTTITPILNFGAVPVFVDVKLPELNIDETKLGNALSPKTKAVILAHTLGNPFNISAVTKFCKDNNLFLIEDNCDALGSKYSLNGEDKFTGTFGDLGTSSFYPPHHMTMGEGGAVYTDDPLLNRIVLSLRDWGRDCICHSGEDNRCGHRFDGKYGTLPTGYDHKYVYSTSGYNLGITDMQAAIGVAQLDKLDTFTAKRIEHFNVLYEALKADADRMMLPRAEAGSTPSWFGFPITLREGMDREKLLRFLDESGIQTRLLFAGNITRQPMFDAIRGDNNYYRVAGELTNTDIITERTFWIGVYPGMTMDRLMYMAKMIHRGLRLQ